MTTADPRAQAAIDAAYRRAGIARPSTPEERAVQTSDAAPRTTERRTTRRRRRSRNSPVAQSSDQNVDFGEVSVEEAEEVTRTLEGSGATTVPPEQASQLGVDAPPQQTTVATQQDPRQGRVLGIANRVRLGDQTDDVFVLNDLVFTIPPLSIQVNKHSFTQTHKTPRTSNAIKSMSGQSEAEIIFSVMFIGVDQFRKYLRRLIANFKYAPIAFIENSFVRNQINPDFIFGPGTSMAVTLDSLSVSSLEGQPDSLLAECRCRLFNYKPFSSNFFFKKDWRTERGLALPESIMGDLDTLTSRFGSQAIAPNVAVDDINGRASATAEEHVHGLVPSSPVRFPGNSQAFDALIKKGLAVMDYVPDSWSNKITFNFREYRRVSLPKELVELQNGGVERINAPTPPSAPQAVQPPEPAATIETTRSRTGAISVPSGTYILPTGDNRGRRINSPFGARALAVRASNWHRGIDIYLPLGSPMYAIADGVIADVMPHGGRGNGGFGRIVVVHHPQLSVYAAYGHCSGFPEGLRRGSPVRAGDVVAFSGRSTGGGNRPIQDNGSPHLHFEIRRTFGTSAETRPLSNCMDPEVFLARLGLAYPLMPATRHYHLSRGRAIYPPRVRGNGTPLVPAVPGVSNPDYDQTWPMRASGARDRYPYGGTPTRPRIPLGSSPLPVPSSPSEVVSRSGSLNPPRRRSLGDDGYTGEADQGDDAVIVAGSQSQQRQTPTGPVETRTPTPQAQEQAAQSIQILGQRLVISERAREIYAQYIAENAVNGWRHYSAQMPQVMDVFYKDYQDADGIGFNIFQDDEELIPIAITGVYKNSFATIPLLSHQYPTYQFMGGNDAVVAIRFNAINQEKLNRLQVMFDLMESNARNFRFVKNSWVIDVTNNEFFKLFSIKQVVVENLDARTHPGNPELYDVTLTVSEFKLTKEALVRENATTQGQIERVLRRIFAGANSRTGNDFLRFTNDPDSIREVPGSARPTMTRRIDRRTQLPRSTRQVEFTRAMLEPHPARATAPWLHAELRRIAEDLNETDRALPDRAFAREVGADYGDLFGAEELLRGQARTTTDLARTQSTDDLAARATGALSLAPVVLARTLDFFGATDLAAQVRGGQTDIQVGRRYLREIISARLRALRSRLLAVGEQIYSHAAQDEFAALFPDVAESVHQVDHILAGQAYPDLALPANPATGEVQDTDPDFYFYSDYADAGIGRILDTHQSVANGFLSNAYGSFGSIVGVSGTTDWFNTQYVSRTRRAIENQARENWTREEGGQRNPYQTMEGWDGQTPSTSSFTPTQNPSEFFNVIARVSGGARIPLETTLSGTRTPYQDMMTAIYGGAVSSGVQFGGAAGDVPEAQHNFSLAHVQSILRQSLSLFKATALKMARAFPTFKLYFLQENSQSLSRYVSFDDFYSYSSVKEIRITRHRKIPADLCVIRLTNLSGILSNASYYNRANDPNTVFAHTGEGGSDGIPRQNLQQYNPWRRDLGSDAQRESAFDALLLKEGCKVQVRLGYKNNAEDLPICFTGQIVEIQNNGRPDELVLIAQSYGVELVLEQKGKDPDQTQVFENTMELLSAMMCSPEVIHFGRWALNATYSPYELRNQNTAAAATSISDYLTQWVLNADVIRSLLSKWVFLSDPQDDNLFPPPANTYIQEGVIASTLDAVFGQDTVEAFKYSPSGNTIWDIFKEMELRHPGWIAQPEYYGDRMTMFFGIPSQRYWAKPFTESERLVQERLNRERQASEQRREGLLERQEDIRDALRDAHEELEREREHLADREAGLNAPLGGNRVQRERTMRDRRRAIQAHRDNIERLEQYIRNTTEHAGQTEVRANQEVPRQQGLADASALLANGRLKPFRSYYLLTSFNHIISNEIKASSKNVANAIQVGYYERTSGVGTLGTTPREVFRDAATFDKLQVLSMKADDNISDHMTQYAYYSSYNCKTRFIARRYGCALIARHLRDVYKGRLIVTGEPGLKPSDVCYVFDTLTDMFGPIEVKGVTHIFDEEGFRSEIMPDLCVDVNEWSTCGIRDAIQLVAMQLGVDVSASSVTGRDIDAYALGVLGRVGGAVGSVATVGAYGGAALGTSIAGPPLGSAIGAGVGAVAAPALVGTVGTVGPAAVAVPMVPALAGPVISAGTLAAPLVAPVALVTAGGAYLAMYGGLKYLEWTQERQPVIVTPLLFAGKPFIAGLDGFRQDGLISNLTGQFRRWSEDLGIGLNGLLAGGNVEQIQAEIFRSLLGAGLR